MCIRDSDRGEQHQEPGRTSALRRNTRCIRVRQHNARRGRPRGRGRRGGRWLVSVREGLEVGDDRSFIGRAEAEVSELDGVDVRLDLGGGPAVGLQRFRLGVGARARAPGKHVARVVEVDDGLEALEVAVGSVRLDDAQARPEVDVAQGRHLDLAHLRLVHGGGYLKSAGYPAAVYEPEMGKVKVPTLRNVDLRPSLSVVKAYGANGYFKSLEGVVHFYNTRDVLARCPGPYTEAEALKANCWPAPEVAANVNTVQLGNLGLSPSDEAAIVAYLKT